MIASKSLRARGKRVLGYLNIQGLRRGIVPVLTCTDGLLRLDCQWMRTGKSLLDLHVNLLIDTSDDLARGIAKKLLTEEVNFPQRFVVQLGQRGLLNVLANAEFRPVADWGSWDLMLATYFRQAYVRKTIPRCHSGHGLLPHFLVKDVARDSDIGR